MTFWDGVVFGVGGKISERCFLLAFFCFNFWFVSRFLLPFDFSLFSVVCLLGLGKRGRAREPGERIKVG